MSTVQYFYVHPTQALRHVESDGTVTKQKTQTVPLYHPRQFSFDRQPVYDHFVYPDINLFHANIKRNPAVPEQYFMASDGPFKILKMVYGNVISDAQKARRVARFLTDAYFHDRSSTPGASFFKSFAKSYASPMAFSREYDTLLQRNLSLPRRQLAYECALIQLYFFAKQHPVPNLQHWYRHTVTAFYTDMMMKALQDYMDEDGNLEPHAWTPLEVDLVQYYNPELAQAERDRPGAMRRIFNSGTPLHALPPIRGPDMETFAYKYNFNRGMRSSEALQLVPHPNEAWLQGIHRWNQDLHQKTVSELNVALPIL